MPRSRTYLSVKFYVQQPNKCQRQNDCPLHGNTCVDVFFMLTMTGLHAWYYTPKSESIFFPQQKAPYQKEKELHVFGTEIFYVDNKFFSPRTTRTTSIYLEDEISDLCHQNSSVYQGIIFSSSHDWQLCLLFRFNSILYKILNSPVTATCQNLLGKTR